MAAITMGGFPARPGADRNAFLLFVALVWVGVLSGFGTDSFNHVSRHGLDYPVIVHFHAIAFVSWLVLFTMQVGLIRSRRIDIHKRLGLAGAGLAAVMVVLGSAPPRRWWWTGLATSRRTRPPSSWLCSSPTSSPSRG